MTGKDETEKGARLTERDERVFVEIERWRWSVSRHIKHLGSFSSQRTADRRIKILIGVGYIERCKILYGVPHILSLTVKGKTFLGQSQRKSKLRVDQARHGIAVIDTAIFFNKKHGIEYSSMITEKQLHSLDGFSARKHRPDFAFETENNQKCCVEVELTSKSRQALENNVRSNFIEYDTQYWIVPLREHKTRNVLTEKSSTYPNIIIFNFEEVQECLKN